ncbi:MAG: ribonuclease P protein component [Clostridia bacterium]
MKKINTLKKNYEFSNVIKRGNYHVKKQIIVYITKNNKNKNIIGIAISTKLCNAVNRNKIKRIIRESYYREMKNKNKDIILFFFGIKKNLLKIFVFKKCIKK